MTSSRAPDQKENAFERDASFEGDFSLTSGPLYLWLSPEAAHTFDQRGLITWQTANHFLTEESLTLPRLLTGDFQALRDLFVHHFMSNPASQDIIAQQDQWGVTILEEFQKPRAGVFETVIQAMVQTNQERRATLEKLHLLRFFSRPYRHGEGQEGQGLQKKISVKVPFQALDADLLKGMTAVTYTDDLPLSLQEKTFLRGMFGPQGVKIEALYQDLFATRARKCIDQGEKILFAHHNPGENLQMKLLL